MPYTFAQALRKRLKYDGGIYNSLNHCFYKMICTSGPNQMTLYFL